jgi:NADH-quinone oxidoreductase subunit F
MAASYAISECTVVRDGIDQPRMHDIDTYSARGGYAALRRCVETLAPEAVIDQVEASGLTGRGGADFPTGMKWRTVARSPGVGYVVVNGKESEPGAFKDRELMEQLPHRVLEGALIAAHAVGADEVVFFIRGAYRLAYRRIAEAVAQAEQAGLIGELVKAHVHLHRSPEAYICGEETALIEALEGRRPMPRGKPPYPAVQGFQGRPTLVNNVETLANVPAIIARGPEWYRGLGTPEAPGTRVFSVSGHVARPGTYECELGVPLSGLLQLAGGVRPGHTLKGVIPGGTSTPILLPRHVNVPLAPKSLKEAGSLLGTASVIVYDETVCMVDVAANLSQFYRDESCGKCTPCRDGTEMLLQLLTRIEAGEGQPDDLELLNRICEYVPAGSICGLGVAAVVPAVAMLRHFRAEVEEHFRLGRCPIPRRFEVAGQCFPVVPPEPSDAAP